MNSCLYECDIFHARFEPKKYSLKQKLFTFYLDLDELEELPRKCFLFSRNRFNLFDFRDRDHLEGTAKTAKENILNYLKSKGVSVLPEKIMLMTHVRVLGCVFNPVSFYFCFDKNSVPLCLVAEVGNTFGEQKPFFLGQDKFKDGIFKDRQVKYYYISPFVDLDAELEFQVGLPGESFDIRVDDWKDGKKFFISTMTGKRTELSDKTLLWYALRYPLVTLGVIVMIHWHAWRLHRLGVPHHPKEDRPDLQREVTREYKKR